MKMDQELQTFTIEEFQADFDNIMSMVETGENFIINYDGSQFILMSFHKYSESYIDKTTNNL